MIPSGYKEDTVFSAIPTDGSGDLSFTRASNGTRINSAGLVEVCPWNLVEYSNTFSNSAWVKSSCTFTSGQNDPNGGTNGWRYLSSVASSGYSYQNGVLQNGVQYTFYIYAKSNTGSNQTMYFTANSGSFTSPAFTLTSTWQLCSWTFTANATGDNILFGYNPSATLDLLVYGAQLNIGSTAKPYFPTTDRLNVPRLTYQNGGGGGCPSLLLEKQSTNVLQYSEQLDNSYWIKYLASITANQAISPDGTQNADLMVSSGSDSLVYKTGITAASLSYFVKAKTLSTNSRFHITVDGVGSASWNQDGTLFQVSGGTASNAINYGNGWYRCNFNVTSGSVVNFGITNTTSGNEIYIWGLQNEAGSYPTSYIPTTSASATRVADACSKTSATALIGQTEGTIYWEGIIDAFPTDNSFFGVQKTASSFVIRFGSGGSSIYAQAYNGSANLFFETMSYTLGTRIKLAFGYKAGSYAFYSNGTQIATGSNATTMPTCDSIMFNSLWGNIGNGSYKSAEAVLFKTRLTNAELASLTTL
jgi:hypothetical protein